VRRRIRRRHRGGVDGEIHDAVQRGALLQKRSL
jgi:hypothetical protein